MNERIRELWDQAAGHAGAFPSGQNNSLETHADFMEKFAELIVRECAELTCWRDYGMSAEQRVRLEVCQDIKKHFGVEE